MNTNSKKTYLSIAISSILYASTAMNANADSCTDYTVTDICEQSKYGAGEFHNIKLLMVSLLVAKITILSLMVKDMNYTILTRISLLKLPQVPFAIPK